MRSLVSDDEIDEIQSSVDTDGRKKRVPIVHKVNEKEPGLGDIINVRGSNYPYYCAHDVSSRS